jgi:hypothetical protein
MFLNFKKKKRKKAKAQKGKLGWRGKIKEK